MKKNYSQIKNVFIKSNTNMQSKKVFHIIINKLKSKGFRLMSDFNDECELVVCIGGDGLFLKTVRELGYPQKPIFAGINTGHLGFFQETLPVEMDYLIDCIIQNSFQVQEIKPLQAIIKTKIKDYELFSINEFAIKGFKNKTVHIDVAIDSKHIEKFSGDGIIISSSAGSTAYNYSAGGSIIDPRLNLIQVTPIAPLNSNAYRSFTSGIILPYSSKVRITPENQYQNTALFLADAVQYKYERLYDIEIGYSKNKVKLLRIDNYQFWKKVKEKFL